MSHIKMDENNQKYMPHETMPPELEDEVQLSDYIQVITKHKYLIVVSVVACLILTVVYNQFSTRIYKATSSIVIPPQPKNALLAATGINLPGSFNADMKDFNTEIHKISSTLVARRALEILVEKGHFKDEQLGSMSNDIFSNQAYAANNSASGGRQSAVATSTMESKLTTASADPSNSSESPYHLSDQSPLVDMILKSVNVSEIKKTNVVEISATHSDPELARDIADAMALAFTEYTAEYRYTADAESLRYLTDEIDDVRDKLMESEINLSEYRIHRNILDPELFKELYVSNRTGLDMNLVELRNQRVDAEATIEELRSILKSPKNKVVLPETSIIPSGKSLVFEGLREKLIVAQLEKNTLATRVTHTNRDYIAAQSRISMLNRRLREEIKNIIEGLEFEIEVIANKEKVIEDMIHTLDQATNEKQKNNIQYLLLQRDAESYVWLYQYLIGSVLVAEINAKKLQGAVEIFSHAKTPSNPIKPRVALNLMLGLVLGLMGGVGFAFALESMDQGINKPEEVEEYTGVPLLSILPHLRPELAMMDQTLIVEKEPQNHFSEGISRLWLNLKLLVEFKGLDAIIIASALAEEGKTTVSSNLASIIGNNQKTMLLGCDFRKPSLKKFFKPGKETRFGLNDAIGMLYQHPSEFGADELRFGDMHTLIKAQKLSGIVELLDGNSGPLRFYYQNGSVNFSNVDDWKKNHPGKSVEKFLEIATVRFHGAGQGGDPENLLNGAAVGLDLVKTMDGTPANALMARIENELTVKGDSKGLYILEAKAISFSPSELIGSLGMRELIRILRNSFDMVIVDTPPSMPFADINAFAGIIDNILLVVRSGVISRKAISQTINWFKQMNFNVIGYAFNDTQIARDSYYYYGYYSYSQYKKGGYKYYAEKNTGDTKT